MDEPTVGVDPQSRNKILENIVQLNEMGTTIIYTSHYMEEVAQICSRVGIIDHGKLLIEGTVEEIQNVVSDRNALHITLKEYNQLSDQALNELKSIKPFPARKVRPCVFEYIYFARPDSLLNGKSAYEHRKKFGIELAKENKVDADIVVPVPDSGNDDL